MHFIFKVFTFSSLFLHWILGNHYFNCQTHQILKWEPVVNDMEVFERVERDVSFSNELVLPHTVLVVHYYQYRSGEVQFIKSLDHDKLIIFKNGFLFSIKNISRCLKLLEGHVKVKCLLPDRCSGVVHHLGQNISTILPAHLAKPCKLLKVLKQLSLVTCTSVVWTLYSPSNVHMA